MATAALTTAICGLLAQPVLGSLVIALLTVAKRHYAVGQTVMHVAFILPPILGVVSIVLALVARRRIKTTPGMGGKAVATAGLIVGVATLGYMVTTWLVAILGSNLMRDF